MSRQEIESLAQRVTCGELQILIWSHRLPSKGKDAECWTYLSQGMDKVGQPELVITLRRRDTEPEYDFSEEPLSWFKMVYSWGKEGRIIDAYHTHEASFQHWLGSIKLETVTYGMPLDLPGLAIALPTNRLHGIALTKQEATIAKVFGYTRVVGHYGLTERWFPFCPWIDRDRGECVTMAQMKDGLRGVKVPMKKVRALATRWEGDNIILTIPLGREIEVQAAVRQTQPEEVWGFDSALDPDAGSCFYWEHGQKEMRIYGGNDGVQVQYCKGVAYLTFCPQQEKDDWTIVEDGIILLLRDPTWDSVREAITSQRDTQVQLPEGMTFCVEFVRDNYSDAATGLELKAPQAQFRTWHPRNKKWLQDSHLRLERVILPNNLGATPSSKLDVATYIELIGETLAAGIPKEDPGVGKRVIIAQFQLPKGNIKDWFTLAFSPGPEGIDASGLMEKMLVLPRPDVDKFTTMHVIFSVW